MTDETRATRATRRPNRPTDRPSPEAAERRTEERIQVRQVTAYQASWTERERGEEGAFTIQLILDHGADEYVIQPDGDDVEPLLRLLQRSKSAYFDLERRVLMFSNLDVD